jgi:hypothetical protein
MAGIRRLLRLDVDVHHARVAVGHLLAIRIFWERFPYFKYCRAKSKSSLLLTKQKLQERLFSLEGLLAAQAADLCLCCSINC